MSNTFKVGDKITVNEELDLAASICTSDTTKGKHYTLVVVDTPSCTRGKHDVAFVYDVGDIVHLYDYYVSLVKE
jgi:hypothetical protein